MGDIDDLVLVVLQNLLYIGVEPEDTIEERLASKRGASKEQNHKNYGCGRSSKRTRDKLHNAPLIGPSGTLCCRALPPASSLERLKLGIRQVVRRSYCRKHRIQTIDQTDHLMICLSID